MKKTSKTVSAEQKKAMLLAAAASKCLPPYAVSMWKSKESRHV
jgi:hypothetical protein